MAWECGICGQIAGQTEAEAMEHGKHCGEPVIEPVPEPVLVRTPDELAWELMNQRQTAALEVIAVEVAKVARYLERMAYRARS